VSTRDVKDVLFVRLTVELVGTNLDAVNVQSDEKEDGIGMKW
jgi:hypothetical protein